MYKSHCRRNEYTTSILNRSKRQNMFNFLSFIKRCILARIFHGDRSLKSNSMSIDRVSHYDSISLKYSTPKRLD